MGADGRVVTHSPLTPAAEVQLPDVSLSSSTHAGPATILSASDVKCEAIIVYNAWLLLKIASKQ